MAINVAGPKPTYLFDFCLKFMSIVIGNFYNLSFSKAIRVWHTPLNLKVHVEMIKVPGTHLGY